MSPPGCPPARRKLALETGAPLHPAHVYYDGDDCVVRIDDALDTSSGDVGVITQALADRFAVNIAAHPQDWHMLQPLWLADLSAQRRAASRKTGLMRIGMVCPYSFDVPGGVQSHVLHLAEVLRERGHDVSVLAPSSPHVTLPDYVVSGGKRRADPVQRLGRPAAFRPGHPPHGQDAGSRDGDFDVLHLHEPNAPSLSMLALLIAEGPIVATFHTSTTKSLALRRLPGLLRPWNEKISARIAVSDLPGAWRRALGRRRAHPQRGRRRVVRVGARRCPGYPRPGRTVLFIGRIDEPRKGLPVLLAALPAAAWSVPERRGAVVGRGDVDELREDAGRSAPGT